MFDPKSLENPAGVRPGMSRRNALMSIAALCGLAMTGDVLAAVPGAKAKAPYAPVFLTPASLKLTAVLAELIIPATDTPGAFAVGAHRTIDGVLGVCSSKWSQDQFVRGLARIDEVAMQQHGKNFIALKPARQVELLRALDATRAPFTKADHDFFRQLKSLTLFAYYTSEAGATRELNYAPVPGGYKGDVPSATVGRRWAL
ncbi:MAG: gluconate 2-dehydrogenase subunit 3 family protein [Pseudomonadota bacterium]